MRGSVQQMILIGLLSSFSACSSLNRIPQPILEQGGRTLPAGDLTGTQDLLSCRDDVRRAAPRSIQPRWLPPLGVAANGIVLGTVDVVHPVWPSRDAYRRALERCLSARGYDIRGWH